MTFVILIVIAVAIFFFWKNYKNKQATEVLAKLDGLGEIKGKCIEDLQSVLGAPWLRQSINDRIVQFTWNVGTVTIVARWDKMDKDQIVTFVRGDQL
jgi:hypothetical protein